MDAEHKIDDVTVDICDILLVGKMQNDGGVDTEVLR